MLTQKESCCFFVILLVKSNLFIHIVNSRNSIRFVRLSVSGSDLLHKSLTVRMRVEKSLHYKTRAYLSHSITALNSGIRT